MKFIFLLVFAAMIQSPAFASKIDSSSIAFHFTYDGVEAKALYEAFLAAGASPDSFAGGTKLDIDNVSVITDSNYLDEDSPCYQKETYRVLFTDHQTGKAIDIDQLLNCQPNTAQGIAAAFATIGAYDLPSLWQHGVTTFAAEVHVTYTPATANRDPYSADGTVTAK